MSTRVSVGALAALGVLAAIHTYGGPPAHAADAAAGCRVSSPTLRPVSDRPSFNFGNRAIAVALPRDATFVAVPEGEAGRSWTQRDGKIRTKVGWWRARGALRVSGRRLDGRAPSLRADVGPVSWTSSGSFIPSLLYFPTTGCWKITATAGGERLDAVVRVVKR